MYYHGLRRASIAALKEKQPMKPGLTPWGEGGKGRRSILFCAPFRQDNSKDEVGFVKPKVR